MTIFDEFGKALNDAAIATVDMLGDLAETAKVKTSLVTEKRELEELFIKLGKILYTGRKEKTEETTAIEAMYSQIEEKEARIKDLEAKEAKFRAEFRAKEAKEEPKAEAEEPKEESASETQESEPKAQEETESL